MKKMPLRRAVLAGVSLGPMALASPALAQSTFIFNPADPVISVCRRKPPQTGANRISGEFRPLRFAL